MRKIIVRLIKRRWFPALLLVGGVSLVALFFSLPAALEWALAPARVRAYITEAVEAQGGAITFDDFSSERPGHYRLTNLDLALPSMRVTMDTMELALDWAHILEGWVTLERAILINPSLTLQNVDTEKSLTPTTHLYGDEPSVPRLSLPWIPLTLVVKKIEASGISYRDERGGRLYAMKGLNISLSGKLSPGGGSFDVSLSSAAKAFINVDRPDLTLHIAPHIDISARLTPEEGFVASGAISLIANRLRDAPGKVNHRIDIKLSANPKDGSPRSVASVVAMTLDGKPLTRAESTLTNTGRGWRWETHLSRTVADLQKLTAALGMGGLEIKGAGWIENADFSGGMYDDGGTVQGKLRAGASVQSFTGFGFSLPMGGEVEISSDASVSDNEALTATLELGLKAPHIRSAGVSCDTVHLTMGIGYMEEADLPLSLTARYSAKNLLLPHYSTHSLSGTLEAAGDGTTIPDYAFELATSEGITLAGNGSLKNLGREELSFTGRMAASAKEAGRAAAAWGVPALSSTTGKLVAELRATGKLGNDFASPRLQLGIIGEGNKIGAFDVINQRRLKPTDISLRASGKLGPLGTITALQVSVEATSAGVTVQKGAASGPFTFTATLTSPEPQHDKIEATLTLEAQGATLSGKRDTEPLVFHLVALSDPVEKSFAIKETLFDFGRYGSFSGSGSWAPEGKLLAVNAKGANLDVGAFSQLAPVELLQKTGIDNFGGRISFNLKGQGAFPTRKLPSLAKGESLDMTLQWTDGLLRSTTHDIAMQGAALAIDLRLNEREAQIKLAGSARKMTSASRFGVGAIAPSLAIAMTLSEGNDLTIKRALFEIPALKATATLKGKMGGLSGFDYLRPERILPNLEGELQAHIAIDGGTKSRRLARYTITGAALATATITAKRTDEIGVKGFVSLGSFTAREGKRPLIEKGNGSFPFEKSLRYQPNATESQKPHPGSLRLKESSFFDDLRVTTKKRSGFDLATARIGPIPLSAGRFDLSFVENRLAIDYFRANLLGGNISGATQIKADNGQYLLTGSTIFANINLEKLLTEKEETPGEKARVDGSGNIAIRLGEGNAPKELDISQIDFGLNITRIGTSALNRLFTFLDPENASPAMAGARMALRYARPKRVELTARHGSLTLVLYLTNSIAGIAGPTIRMPVIQRAPIAGLANFSAIRKRLKEAQALNGMMLLVGATSYHIDDDGKLVLR